MLCLFQQLCGSCYRTNQQALAHRGTYGEGMQPPQSKDGAIVTMPGPIAPTESFGLVSGHP